MDVRIKFVGKGIDGDEEIHIWDQPANSHPVKLSDLSAVVAELFGYPQGSKLTFTWFDGEDVITIGSCSELQQVIKDHTNGISGAPFSVLKALRLNVTCKNQIHPVKQFTMHTTSSSVCTPTAIVSAPTIDPSKLHEGFTCDGCEGEIYDIRYKCLACADFDLCFHCFTEGKHLKHPFGAAIISHTYDVSLARSIGTQTQTSYTQEETYTNDVPVSVPVEAQRPASSPSGGAAEWEVLSDDSDSDYVFGNGFSASKDPAEASSLPEEPMLTEPLPGSHAGADIKKPTNPSVATASVKTTGCLSHIVNEPTNSFQECTSSVVEKPKQCTSSQTSSLLDQQTQSPPRMRIATSSVGYSVDDNSEAASETRHTGVSTTTPSALDQVSPSWSLRAAVQEALRGHADYIVEAFRRLRVSPSTTSVDELKVLLDAGYSNENGILTFLLSENGNNAAAVLDILNQQNI
ncbi:Sequestosome-1 [Sparganum proliferum]